MVREVTGAVPADVPVVVVMVVDRENTVAEPLDDPVTGPVLTEVDEVAFKTVVVLNIVTVEEVLTVTTLVLCCAVIVDVFAYVVTDVDCIVDTDDEAFLNTTHSS